ncbi:hypothetical protein ABKW28_06385 [Nocardioides sp. 31GB23]|uniref:hypothetical protein n=1 Tax=Nocardioides sp. 31GB23 TaxID=3156065 RepID=UPI0032AED59E
MTDERTPDRTTDDQEPHFSGRTHTVHTRWTWASLLVLLAGVVVLGIGVILLDLLVGAIGGVLLAAGAVGAWRSGLMWDVDTGSSPADLVSSESETVERPGAGTHQDDEATAEHAEETTHDVRRRLADRRGTRLNLVPVGALLVLLAGAWLALSQWVLYPETPEGRVGTWRAMGGGVVLLLVGLWLLQHGRTLVATAIALVTGAVLVLLGIVGAHDTQTTVASEIGSGAVAVLGALVSLDPRRRR